MSKLINVIIAIFLISETYAEEFRGQEGTIRARISEKHLNRISVKNDKIVSVTGLDGTYILEKNEKLGFALIKPIILAKDGPLSLNITTLSGKTQDLLLDIVDGDPKNIELDLGSSVELDSGDYQSQETEHEAKITEAMKAFINGKDRKQLDIKECRKVNGFKLEFLGGYKVFGFIGYKYLLTSDNGTDVLLLESTFFQEGDIAISFSENKLNRDKPVIMYVLRNK